MFTYLCVPQSRESRNPETVLCCVLLGCEGRVLDLSIGVTGGLCFEKLAFVAKEWWNSRRELFPDSCLGFLHKFGRLKLSTEFICRWIQASKPLVR